jgi:hypothetical protein
LLNSWRRTVAASVIDELCDRQEHEIVIRRKPDQFGHSTHATVIVHEFGDRRDWSQPREACEVDSRLGMTRPAKDTALPCEQWEDVPRSGKIVMVRVRIRKSANRVRAVRSGDAGAHTTASVY